MVFKKRNTYNTMKFLKDWQGWITEATVPQIDNGKGGPS